MTSVLVPAAAIGAGVYLLETQAPPKTLPNPLPTGAPTTYDPMGLSQRATDPDTAAKIDALLQAGEAKFAAMTDAERANAATYINQTLDPPPDPPLTGKETWQQIASVTGGAIGGAYLGPLGAIAGAYLGTTVESWLASSLGDIKTWINQNVPGVVTSWIDDAEKWLSGVI